MVSLLYCSVYISTGKIASEKPNLRHWNSNSCTMQHIKTPLLVSRNGVGRKIPVTSYSPTRRTRSTIGAGGLNGSVRNGKRCGPSAKVTGESAGLTQDPSWLHVSRRGLRTYKLPEQSKTQVNGMITGACSGLTECITCCSEQKWVQII